MPKRKLALRNEHLADLTTDELDSVAGASHDPCIVVHTKLETKIPTRCMCTGYYPSLNAPCTVDAVCA